MHTVGIFVFQYLSIYILVRSSAVHIIRLFPLRLPYFARSSTQLLSSSIETECGNFNCYVENVCHSHAYMRISFNHKSYIYAILHYLALHNTTFSSRFSPTVAQVKIFIEFLAFCSFAVGFCAVVVLTTKTHTYMYVCVSKFLSVSSCLSFMAWLSCHCLFTSSAL